MDIEIYQKQKNKFPLISSVIDGIQDGQILKNSEINPTHFFVINKFGFCQEFYSEFDENFFEKLKQYVVQRKYQKLRCYAPSEKFEKFINTLDFAQKSERIQFKFLSIPPKKDIKDDYRLEKINVENIKSIDFGLNLANRYWKNVQDFVDNAIGFVVFKDSHPIGCCYSAANGLNKAEIDIFVDEKHRKEGLGYALGVKFINECLNKGLKPSWDCYSNNLSSLNLAKKLGFIENLKYNFYNIDGSI